MTGVRQFLWFAVAGGLGFVFDATLLYAMSGFLGWYGARVLSFWGAATLTWLINRNFAFRAASQPPSPSRQPSLLREYLQYLVSMLGGAALNYAAYVAVLVWLHAPYAPLVGVAAGSVAGLFANFFAAKYLVFRQKRGPSVPTDPAAVTQPVPPPLSTGVAPSPSPSNPSA